MNIEKLSQKWSISIKNGRQDKESATTPFLTLSSRPLHMTADKRETRFLWEADYE